MTQLPANLIDQIECLGGRPAATGHPLLDAVWPDGWRYRLGPEFSPYKLTLGRATPGPTAEDGLRPYPDAICFGRDDDDEILLLLLPDGTAFALDTFPERATLAESPAALLAKLELDVAASSVAVPRREGRFYRTFNGSVVFALENQDAVLVLSEPDGVEKSGLPAGTVYELASWDGVFEWPGLPTDEENFLRSNAMSLKEELEFALPPAAPTALPDVPPTYPGETLSATIFEQVYRLGGALPPPPTEIARTDWNGVPVPEPLRRFLFDTQWTAGRVFADEGSCFRVWSYQPAVMDFGKEPYAFFRDHPDAIVIGIADGGNYALVTLASAPDPTDPPVYRLDHDEYQAPPSGPVPLSQFLARLGPDLRAEKLRRAPELDQPSPFGHPPELGRLFRTRNGSIVYVRAVDSTCGEVVILIGGHDFPRDLPGQYPGQAYRVNRNGLYEGPCIWDFRLRLSLVELLPAPPV
ncbi:SMI1/KNR4 family protein [Gemmata sp. G18]|uniref:SMI1/KNR4 family protein n=1 Tax=Gemmata palustris TaxID=2822762 RepID=A0ABS5C6Q0_9BACT|nr:SMI1/KNR4 family protein [Gemmata palustris]MBP3960793.1 SMI1/KNR4 family protein [Gemmata palustris]